MSTRATYRISEELKGENLINYFYIHYDGYPEGAALYFKHLLAYRSEVEELHRKTIAGMFEMALKYSERTADHESHTDTEYRYNISYFENVFYLRAFYSDNTQLGIKWLEFYSDTLDGFIKKYTE